MTMIKIHGYSDDLIMVEGVNQAYDKIENADVLRDDHAEFYVGDQTTFIIGGRLKIYALYNKWGAWTFAPSLMSDEEGESFPDWNVQITRCDDCSYSTQVVIEAPENLRTIERISNDLG